MKNKKTIMLTSAVMIIIYHLWITISPWGSFGYQAERYFRYACSIGVEMFFFLSAYSIAKKSGISFRWTGTKCLTFYGKFLFFLILYTVVSRPGILKALRTAFFIELFTKGGGSFLWFLPAVILLYLLLYGVRKAGMRKRSGDLIACGMLLVMWIAGAFLMHEVFHYDVFYIVWNRIPISVLGYLAGRTGVFEKLSKKNGWYFLLAGVLFIGGNVLYYFRGFHPGHTLLHDAFYLYGAVPALGLLMLLDRIPLPKAFSYPASATLEMYAVQMIFGFSIAGALFTLTGSAVLTNLLSILSVAALGTLFSLAYSLVSLFQERRREARGIPSGKDRTPF